MMERRKEPWARRSVGAVAVLLLAAVPALGLTSLGGTLFPLGRGIGLAGGVLDGPLTFDAPTMTLHKVNPEKAGPEEAIVFTDWKFTQTGDYSLSTASVDSRGRLLQRGDYFNLLLLEGSSLPPQWESTFAGLLVGDPQRLQDARATPRAGVQNRDPGRPSPPFGGPGGPFGGPGGPFGGPGGPFGKPPRGVTPPASPFQ